MTRVLDVPAVANATVTAVTITGGHAPNGIDSFFGDTTGGSGGAILNAGSLTLTDAAVTGSQAGSGATRKRRDRFPGL